MMSIRLYVPFLLFAFIMLTGCNNQEENPRLILAGESSKTWVMGPEEAGQGDAARLSDQPDEKMVFYANGAFQIVNEVPGRTGRWNYNASQDELEIVFDDREEVKEVFHVQELAEDQLVLHAADGTTLRLQPE